MSPQKTPPRPPDKPLPEECCGRGCCPCIFDYYEDALERWRRAMQEAGFDPEAGKSSEQASHPASS